MSNPDPMNDPENERQDDDLLRMEDDARRYEDEQAVRAEMEFHRDPQYMEQCLQRKQWNEAWANWAKGE